MATIKKVGVIILAVIAIYWVFIVSAFFYMGVINPKVFCFFFVVDVVDRPRVQSLCRLLGWARVERDAILIGMCGDTGFGRD